MPAGLSVLTLTVPVPPRWNERDEAVATLRRARSAGITTFDTVDCAEPALAEGLLSLAFPDPDPALVVLTDRRTIAPRSSPLPPSRPGWPGSLGPTGPVPRTASALPSFHRVYEVDPAGPPPGPRGRDPSAATIGSSPLGPVIVRCQRGADLRRSTRGPGPRWLSGPFSILDGRVALAARDAYGPDGLRWVARDPFAGGRLDGSRFAAAVVDRPAYHPRSVRELESEFAPVARLSFLARPRRRTLAQAALRYLADLPWVATVVVPPPTPERWEEIVGFLSSPPLEPGERARVERLAAPVPTAPVEDGGPR